MDWNPKYLYSKVFQDQHEIDYFLEEICNDEWNHEQDAGRSFEEGIRVISKHFPDYAYEISLYYSRWIEMINGSIVENVEIFEELNNEECVNSYSITNWSAQTFPLVRNSYGFFNSFIDIIVSGEEKMAKPDQEIYLLLQNKHALIPSDTIFIDDNVNNSSAAESLGWQSIHYTPETNLAEELYSIIGKN